MEQLTMKPAPSAANKSKVDQAISNALNASQLQDLFDKFFNSTGLGVSLVTSNKQRLARAGWQHICTHFHASNPSSEALCRQSERFFEANLKPGEALLHKCQNGLYEKAISLSQNGKQFGILYFGQFFKKDEPIDKEFFVRQAERFHFDLDAYIDELKHVPILTDEKLDAHIALMQTILWNLAGLK